MVRTKKMEGIGAGAGGGQVSTLKKDPPVGGNFLQEQVAKAITRELDLLKKQLTLEANHLAPCDNTEKQRRLVIAILRMNISALRGTITKDLSKAVTLERNTAVERLVKITNEFDKTKHTAESINNEARDALNELSDTFKVFGPKWTTVRDSIVQLALEQIEEIKKSGDNLHAEKEALRNLEARNRERSKKEEKERKEREKAEKEKKKKKKKNKKTAAIETEPEGIEDFGDERVPPQQAVCTNENCTCHYDSVAQQEYADHQLEEMPSLEVDDGSPSECLSYVPSDPSRSRSSSPDSTSTDNRPPALSIVMPPEYWSQFCYFYDNGSK